MLTTALLTLFLPQAPDQLPRVELLDSDRQPRFAHCRAFAPGEDAARHGFAGRLRILGPRGRLHHDRQFFARQGYDRFPTVELAFVAKDGRLVPASRDYLVDGDPRCAWNLVLSEGRVWHEAGDGDWDRASFPFVLAHKLNNGCLNGIATFLYRKRETSDLHFQIVQQTCAWSRGRFWGRLRAEYTPNTVRRVECDFTPIPILPRRPLADLQRHAEALDLAAFRRGLTIADVSQAAVLYRGTLYEQATSTPYGSFPYPRQMRHGAFSVTKSAAAAMLLFRLAQKHGSSIYTQRLGKWLPLSEKQRNWQAVTFLDCLDMCTGQGRIELGGVDAREAEDEHSSFITWILTPGRQAKRRIALAYTELPWKRRSEFRYQTTATFLLADALDRWLKNKEGPTADIGDLLSDEIFRPLGIHHLPILRTTEPKGERGLPILGYGLLPTIDQIARIAALFDREGKHEDVQLLHRQGVRTALYRTRHRGLPTGRYSRDGVPQRYCRSFWSVPLRHDGRPVQVPRMSGYGGNAVAICPNGAVYIRFADRFEYDVRAPVQELLALPR